MSAGIAAVPGPQAVGAGRHGYDRVHSTSAVM